MFSTALLAALLAACAHNARGPRVSPRDDHQLIRSAISSYDQGDRLTNMPLWVIKDCRPPTAQEIAGLRVSAAGPASPHSGKLYHLYASSGADYIAATRGGETAPIGLTLVKEAHVAKRITHDDLRQDLRDAVQSPDDAHHYELESEVDSLFVMTKIATDEASNTDRGWIYAVIEPDRTTLLASGMIASCVDCHAKAPHAPMFGLSDQ